MTTTTAYTTTLADYAIKNVKTYSGREGGGYQATLYRFGARVGTVVDYGDGGCADFHIEGVSHDLVIGELDAIARQLHPEFASLEDISELAIDALINAYENDKASKKAVVFKKSADDEAIYSVKLGTDITRDYATRYIYSKHADAVVWDVPSRSWVGA